MSRLRWLVHLVVLGSYPLIFGVLGALSESADNGAGEGTPALSGDPVLLMTGVGGQLLLFFTVFGVAWLASRATRTELMFHWRSGIAPLWRGFLYSIGLRILVLAFVVAAALVAFGLDGFDQEALREWRPKVERTVDMEVLAKDPLYLILNVTLVSFVLAGFTEELWRAGVLAALAALFPRGFANWRGKAVSVLIVAVVFGLGHFSQGWGGVAVTTVLGVGLGAIMLFHGSIWDAVIAHGCLNASTFIALFLLFRYFPELDLGFGD